MNLMAAITESTCGEPCWEAREDVCRCSCSGKNHGIYKRGERPERTSKIDSYVYKLIAVGEREVEQQGQELSKQAGEFYIYHCLRQRGKPYRIKAASETQIERWAELAEYKGADNRRRTIYTLWERMGR